MMMHPGLRMLVPHVIVLVLCSGWLASTAHAELAAGGHEFARGEFYPPINHGCALCRGTGNCSIAVANVNAGVYCGDLITTFQPCCCAFRNECTTTIFSERCECLTDEQVEQYISARFTLFCIFTSVMWGLLLYDRMCARPYKVMNSSQHHILANSPSAARLMAPRETAQDQELVELDDDVENPRSTSAESPAATATLDARAEANDTDSADSEEDSATPEEERRLVNAADGSTSTSDDAVVVEIRDQPARRLSMHRRTSEDGAGETAAIQSV